MSSKGTSAMGEESSEKSALVPRLRFPGFGGSVLRNVQLGDVTEESSIRNGDRLSVSSVMGVTKSEGIVPMEARLMAADISRYKLVQNDWFAYNPMRLNIGSIARWNGKREILVSPDYVVFKCCSEGELGLDSAYLEQFRQTKAWEEFVTEGGDGSVRVRIYYKDIAGIRLVLPSLHEQQKIADCLFSLDELITAETQKLDALKTHKKGLMQQLFPREGETVPRLRFPEFREAPEWGKAMLQELVTTVSPPSKIQSSSYLPQGKFPIIDQSQEIICGWTNDESTVISESLPLIVFGDHTCAIKFVGKPFAQGADGIKILKAKTVISAKFLFHSLNHRPLVMEDYKRHFSILKERLVFYPDIKSGEQQKIADCLSSLDELITAQSQKIDALKTHKKGLMQQLFPVLAEAPA